MIQNTSFVSKREANKRKQELSAALQRRCNGFFMIRPPLLAGCIFGCMMLIMWAFGTHLQRALSGAPFVPRLSWHTFRATFFDASHSLDVGTVTFDTVRSARHCISPGALHDALHGAVHDAVHRISHHVSRSDCKPSAKGRQAFCPRTASPPPFRQGNAVPGATPRENHPVAAPRERRLPLPPLSVAFFYNDTKSPQ